MGKNCAAALVAALGISLLGVAPAQAAVDHPARQRAWIQGTVTDQAGHPLDDVNVEAVPADDPEGDPVASWITYEGPEVGEEHGWFRLYVPAGKYVVRFSSLGDGGDQYRSRLYTEGGEVKNLTVQSQQVRELDDSALVHAGRVPSTTRSRLVDTSIMSTDNGLVRFTVGSPFVDPIEGKVTVTVGGVKVDTVSLVHGAGRLRLARLPAGRYAVAVAFLGSVTVKPSRAVAELTVSKSRKKHHHRPVARPNAW